MTPRCGVSVKRLLAVATATHATRTLGARRTVTATGRDAAAIREGDRVVMAVPPACGACAECRAGHGHRCAAIMALAYGIHPLTPPHGGYAPRIAVPGDSLVVVPDDLDVDAAAMVEPATVVLHAIRRRPPRPAR